MEEEKTGNPLLRKDYKNVHLENTNLAMGHQTWVKYYLTIIMSWDSQRAESLPNWSAEGAHFEFSVCLNLAVGIVCKYILAQANPL